ncbi:hypothetical protein Ahy_B06g085172 isoform C [Arachis hypogaea]|uniref:Uncharacterized protein n=1 Tax=Arachis hypogaea TaxID=3818 RepID=A0A444YTR8_ARAHY|nr:hypothetical protein Ahy_B06g085172 isoform C [Arachis hypogaea]
MQRLASAVEYFFFTFDLVLYTTFDENKTPQNSEENELAMYLLSWILQLIKGKVWELIENFQSLVNDFFHSPKMQHVDPAVLHEKLRSSLLLCIVILLIVIMARLERS